MKNTVRLAYVGALALLLCVPAGCRDNGRSGPAAIAGDMPVWRCMHYGNERVVQVGETVQRNGRGAKVKLLEIAAEKDAGLFEVDDQGRTYRGWVRVGQAFAELTPVFGREGATLVAADQDRATVLFQWSEH